MHYSLMILRMCYRTNSHQKSHVSLSERLFFWSNVTMTTKSTVIKFGRFRVTNNGTKNKATVRKQMKWIFFKQFAVVAAVHWNPLWEFITLNEFFALHNPKKKPSQTDAAALKTYFSIFEPQELVRTFQPLAALKTPFRRSLSIVNKICFKRFIWLDRNDGSNSNTEREKATTVRWNELKVYPIFFQF